eukprot:TRINITY_DN13948_c0_g1_i1.p1 TRINITY_DN13948_c0_g1~~TRINITY_DN13948_c0_g1_i1.p1  ORF type:complete len:832 (+),score=187.68 TRINITY_DN13948_c0_g1_i1:58-2553(+)
MMGCCGDAGAGGELGVPDDGGPQRGLRHQRGCTDPLPAVVFLLFCGGWGFVGSIALGGDLSKLLHPADSSGQRCGGSSRPGAPALFAPVPALPQLAVCLPACPGVGDVVCEFENASAALAAGGASSAAAAAERAGLVSRGRCWLVTYSSALRLWRCIPTGGAQPAAADPGELAALADDWLADDPLRAGIAEVHSCRYAIGVAAGAAVALCVCVVVLLRAASAAMLWVAVLGFIPLSLYAAYRCWEAAASISDRSTAGDDRAGEIVSWTFRAMALALAACCLPFLFALVWIWQRVRIAAEVLRAAGQAAADEPGAMGVGTLASLAVCGLTGVWWGLVTLHLAAVEDTTELAGVNVTSPATSNGTAGSAPPRTLIAGELMGTPLDILQAVNVVGALWLLGFASSLGSYCRASCVAVWYFSATATSGDGKHVDCGTAWGSLCTALRCHAGTLLASGLLAVFGALPRPAFLFAAASCQRRERSPSSAVSACASCVVSCADATVRRITPWVCGLTALYGLPYCASAAACRRLAAANVATLGTVSDLTETLLFLLRVEIAIGASVFAWELFDSDTGGFLDGPVAYGHLALLGAAVVNFALADILVGAYGDVVTFEFVCILIDRAGDGPSHFVPAELGQLVAKYGEVERTRVEYEQALNNQLHHAGVAVAVAQHTSSVPRQAAHRTSGQSFLSDGSPTGLPAFGPSRTSQSQLTPQGGRVAWADTGRDSVSASPPPLPPPANTGTVARPAEHQSLELTDVEEPEREGTQASSAGRTGSEVPLHGQNPPPPLPPPPPAAAEGQPQTAGSDPLARWAHPPATQQHGQFRAFRETPQWDPP